MDIRSVADLFLIKNGPGNRSSCRPNDRLSNGARAIRVFCILAEMSLLGAVGPGYSRIRN